MNLPTLILASNSPRRKELLSQIGLPFEVLSCNEEEVIHKTLPGEIVEELSCQKAHAVSALAAKRKEPLVVLGADTIVAYGNEILLKPKDKEDAVSTLSHLQGHTHTVYTGVTLIPNFTSRPAVTFHTETKVTMYPMSNAEILTYIASNEPMDKAGSYAIQGLGAKYIREIMGDYNTVVGLPIGQVYQTLVKEFSLPW